MRFDPLPLGLPLSLPLVLLLGLTASSCGRRDRDPAPGKGTEPLALHFTDATAASGLAFTSLPRPDDAGYGQGVAVADIDRDGDLDLFFTQDRGPCALYRNEGGLVFTEIAAAAGVQVSAVEAHAKGCAFFDYDRDGFPDLFVGTAGEGNRLFRNLGNGTFEDRTAASGMGGGTGVVMHGAPGDYDGDGFPDLYEVDMAPWDFAPPGGPTGDPAPNRLWRNHGDGTFTDEAAALGVADPRAGWAALWTDLDGDRLPDLLLANDFYFYQPAPTADRAWRNCGPGEGFAFTDRAEQEGYGIPHSCMGFASGDLDGDGTLDLYAADVAGCELRLGSDPPRRPDRAPQLGLAVNFDDLLRPQVSWGISIEDYDADGWNDLLVFNGLLQSDDPGAAGAHLQPPGLHLNRPKPDRPRGAASAHGRVFPDVTADAGLLGLACPGARAAVPADLDGDGDLDLVVATRFGAARILRNDLPAGAPWYGVRLRGVRATREGFGAMLELKVGGRTWIRPADAGGQSGASFPPEWIFHPGMEGTAHLTVRWPDGGTTEVDPVENGWTAVDESE